MTTFVALLRAVNVGGTGTLPMSVLAELCAASGFERVRTVLASGNALFRSDGSEAEIRTALEARLHAHAGRSIGVLVRTAAEMADTLACNPFADAPGNRVMALFTDAPLPADPLDGATGLGREQIRPGRRELFVFYPDGMARSRLRLPADRSGTARNMNTVARLAALSVASD